MEADFSVNYNESSFWEKIKAVGKKAGKNLIESALVLFYVLQDPTTPPWAKTVIVGALGYLISPVDAIPDVIPVIGFTDDAGVLAGALITVATCISTEHRKQAASKAAEWFE